MWFVGLTTWRMDVCGCVCRGRLRRNKAEAVEAAPVGVVKANGYSMEWKDEGVGSERLSVDARVRCEASTEVNAGGSKQGDGRRAWW